MTSNTKRSAKIPRSSVTIRQVAEIAAISIGTVSRVINGYEGVDRELRSRVEHTIRALGYRPNILAQNFVRNQSPIISFALSNSGVLDALQALILIGIEEYCEQTGYFVLFTRFQYDPQLKPNRITLPKVLESNGLTRGVIVAGLMHDNCLEALKNLGLPYVVLANHTASESKREQSNQVRYDDDRIFYEATNYLIQLGHKDIWFIGDTALSSFRTRYEGYSRSMMEHSLQPRAQMLPLSQNAIDNDVSALNSLWKKENK